MRSVFLWAMVLILFSTVEFLCAKDANEAVFSRSIPDELRFSDALTTHQEEEEYAETLSKVDSLDRLSAARALWQGHSRKYASNVLKFLAVPLGGDAFRTFQREVEAAMQMEAILHELKEGDYRWGAWLAFLRPHKDIVAVLLEGLKDKPEMLPETVLALGNSGDQRALEPLLTLLKVKDYQIPGEAARALGYLGKPETEPKLIEALSSENNWLRVNACVALAKMGTKQALATLEKMSKDNHYTGALNVRGMAEFAVECIKNRERAGQPSIPKE